MNPKDLTMEVIEVFVEECGKTDIAFAWALMLRQGETDIAVYIRSAERMLAHGHVSLEDILQIWRAHADNQT